VTTLANRHRRASAEQAAVDAWNRYHPIGTPVVAYPGCRPEDSWNPEKVTRIVTSTRSKAIVLGGHTAVVWVHGHGACIALTHVDVRTQATPGESAEMRHWVEPLLDYTRRPQAAAS
jgi:hypothetical protein